ncbi:MAG TPA: FkbM family methyltransferase [Azospirillaceae bacterium]|nr:FkbM family methyltransferase [Azospirillaceae bacterium]
MDEAVADELWTTLEARLSALDASSGDLTAVEDEADRAIRLEGRPLALLAAGSQVGGPFVRRACETLDVRLLVDNAAAGQPVAGRPTEPEVALADAARRHPGLVAVICGFSMRTVAHFRNVAAAAGVPSLVLPQALHRFGMLGPDEANHWLRHGHPEVVRDVARRVRAGGYYVDPLSRATAAAVMLYRLTWNPTWLDAVRRPGSEEYVSPDAFPLQPGEVIVDGGAYTGDTVEVFHRATKGAYGHIHAFEPDPTNFERLQDTAARLGRVAAYKAGLWSETTELRFEPLGGLGSRFAEHGDLRVPVLALDDVEGLAPTLVKLDVEGAEAAALRGGAKLISRLGPKIAAAAYHRPEDLVELPELLRGLRKDYQFRLLHHGDALYETVLYAWRAG